MLRFTHVIGLILATLTAVNAQNKISGRVVDASTNEPIPNAVVKGVDSETGAITDIDGAFNLKIEGAVKKLLISHVSYKRKVVDVVENLIVPLEPGVNLESVIIQGVRASQDDPVTQTTVNRKEIEATYNGEQPIYLLEELTPSIVTYSESGTKVANYGNLRLRGISQERVNMTLNGVPLNDMIDHGVFFSNFTDIGNSFESVQIQRGVGTTTNGSASYAGSINFESINLEDQQAGGEVQLGAGSFGTYRANVNMSSGLVDDKFSYYGSYSKLYSDGYRDNTFTNARSFFFSGGYFGKKDVVKITAFDSRSRNGLGYLTVAKSDLEQDPTINYLDENDEDDFGQRFVQLQHSHNFSKQFKTTSSLYYGGAGGDYFYTYNDTDSTKAQINYPLTNDHLGLIVNGFWNSSDDKLNISSGIHTYVFNRVNEESFSPDFENPYYHETSMKSEFSWFGKVEWQSDKWLITGDIQVRAQKLVIRPDYDFIGIADEGDIEKDWTFINPKLGVRYKINPATVAYASFGRTGREPTKVDIFGGFNLGAANYDFARSDEFEPEFVNDLEVGLKINKPRLSFSGNYFYMDFENEIAPIGEVLAFGVQKRVNIPDSYRTGVEAQGAYVITPGFIVSGNLTYMKSGIKDFTTSEGVSYTNTTPIFSPEWMGKLGATYELLDDLKFNVYGTYVGDSFLELTNNSEFVLPDYWLANFRVNYEWKNLAIAFEVNNMFDEEYYTNGSPLDVDFDGTPDEPGYLVNAGRNYFLTTKFSF